MKVSVILPVYNVSAYLQKCLSSIANQSFSDLEIIAINDGSTDDSLSILESFAEKEPRLNIVNQTNLGLSGARNTGLKHANGDYILFVDSDDYIELNLIETVVKASNGGAFDLVSFGSIVRNEEGEAIGKYPVKKDVEMHGGEEALELFFGRKLFRNSAWNKLIKHSVIKDHGLKFIEGTYYEDFPFTTELLLKAKKIKTIKANLYNYVKHEGSITGTISEKHLSDTSLVLGKVEKLLAENDVLYQLQPLYLKYGSEIWRYTLKQVIKINPISKNYIRYREVIPQKFWNKLPFKYRMFCQVGRVFPKFPGNFVKQP